MDIPNELDVALLVNKHDAIMMLFDVRGLHSGLYCGGLQEHVAPWFAVAKLIKQVKPGLWNELVKQWARERITIALPGVVDALAALDVKVSTTTYKHMGATRWVVIGKL